MEGIATRTLFIDSINAVTARKTMPATSLKNASVISLTKQMQVVDHLIGTYCHFKGTLHHIYTDNKGVNTSKANQLGRLAMQAVQAHIHMLVSVKWR